MNKIIIYVGSFILPDGNAAAQRVLANAKAFRDLGYQVVFIGTDKNMKRGGSIFDSYFETDAFDCYKTPYPLTAFHWLQRITGIRQIRQIAVKYGEKKIYAVIAYNYPAVALRRLLSYCNKRNIKLIADCTEWYGRPEGSSLFRVMKWLDTHYRMRHVHTMIGHVICASSYLCKYYNDRGCNTVIIPSLIDKADPKWSIGAGYRPNAKKTFVFAGSPGVRNDKERVDLIVDAFYECKKANLSFKLRLIGIAKESFLERLPSYDRKLQIIDGDVDFMGRIPHRDVIRITKEADYTIFIRDDNRITRAGFPTKLVESLSCGTPVITNTTSDISQYIIDGVTGFLVEDSNLESIQNTLNRAIVASGEQLKKMHNECAEQNQFDYRLYLEELSAFLSG